MPKGPKDEKRLANVIGNIVKMFLKIPKAISQAIKLSPLERTMIANREKLINAMIFFVQNTKHCHTLKLFKLLYFLDFEHFRQTGRSVTGQCYVAWKRGPVPNALWHELQHGGDAHMQNSLKIIQHTDGATGASLFRKIKPIATFNKSLFSKRELAIMERLAFFLADLKADDMSEFSHDKRLPWCKIYAGGDGEGKAIPLELSLDSEPIIKEAPTIAREDLAFRNDLVAGL